MLGYSVGMNSFHLHLGMEHRKPCTRSQRERAADKVVLAGLGIGGRHQEYRVGGGLGSPGWKRKNCCKGGLQRAS